MASSLQVERSLSKHKCVLLAGENNSDLFLVTSSD